MKNKGVTIVIGSFNRKRVLQLSINSLRAELCNCGFPQEIIVVDGGSTDGLGLSRFDGHGGREVSIGNTFFPISQYPYKFVITRSYSIQI